MNPGMRRLRFPTHKLATMTSYPNKLETPQSYRGSIMILFLYLKVALVSRTSRSSSVSTSFSRCASARQGRLGSSRCMTDSTQRQHFRPITIGRCLELSDCDILDDRICLARPRMISARLCAWTCLHHAVTVGKR